jgi:hypothetical protein
MRVLTAIFVVLCVGFVAVMGFLYLRDGSLEQAGASMDEGLQKVDETTQPLQDGVGELGEGVKKTIDNATDGDDAT